MCPLVTRRRCNALQHTATHCDTQRHFVSHCNMPVTIVNVFTSDTPQVQHTATHCNTLQHTATHCSILQHTATHCSILQHAAMSYCNTLLGFSMANVHIAGRCLLQCVAVCFRVLQCATSCCNTGVIITNVPSHVAATCCALQQTATSNTLQLLQIHIKINIQTCTKRYI